MGAVEGAVGACLLLSPLSSLGLPLEPPVGVVPALAAMGGPVLLELWNEPDRAMPSETGRGLRAGGGG